MSNQPTFAGWNEVQIFLQKRLQIQVQSPHPLCLFESYKVVESMKENNFPGTTLTWLLFGQTALSPVLRIAALMELRWWCPQRTMTGLLLSNSTSEGHICVAMIKLCTFVVHSWSFRWVVLADSPEFKHMDEDIESLKCFCDWSSKRVKNHTT